MVEDQWRLFENGMVTTIEPGIYIDDGEDIPKNFRNIGIRIEDMVLVKNNTPDILSKNIEKDPNSIEDIIKN
jgi:Xaa-Pro aminopeptidase